MGDLDGGIVPMGEVASGMKEMIYVAEFIPGMVADAAAVLNKALTPLRDVRISFAVTMSREFD
jgi:hypothetical protein